MMNPEQYNLAYNCDCWPKFRNREQIQTYLISAFGSKENISIHRTPRGTRYRIKDNPTSMGVFISLKKALEISAQAAKKEKTKFAKLSDKRVYKNITVALGALGLD